MNIKEAEALSGVSRRNIRFYEQKGLLKPGRNSENDYREYTEADIEALKRIRALRMVDMPLEQIREVMEGTLPLQTAVAAHKKKLQTQIRELETAMQFCDEFTAAETVDFDEILRRMDAPENREKLSKSAERDHTQSLIDILAPILAGLIPTVGGAIFGSIAFVCIHDMPVISHLMCFTAFALWAAFGCWVWDQGRWLTNALLIHVIPFVLSVCTTCMHLLPQTPLAEYVSAAVLLGFYPMYFTCYPIAYTLGVYDHVSVIPMAFLTLAFCIGGLIGKLRTDRKAKAFKDASA